MPREPEAWGWRSKPLGDWAPQGDYVGWLDGADVLLEPDAAFKVAKKFASDQSENLPVTQYTLWKRMAEKGLLASREPGKNTVKRTVGKKRRHVLHVASDTLSTVPETIEPEEDEPLF